MSVDRAVASRDSLLPREHGAYAEVGFPLATALGLAAPSVSGLLLTTSIVCAFLLHEPVLVLMGRRGTRLMSAAAVRARMRVAVLAMMCLLAGATGAWLGDGRTRGFLVGAVPVVFALGWLIATRREKTWAGEAFIATALPFASVPVALGCGVPGDRALLAAAVWALVFLLGTSTVQSIRIRAKRGSAGPAVATICIALVVGAGAVGMAVARGVIWPLAILPPSLVSGLILAAGTTPHRLRTVGWAMLTGYVVTAALLLVGFHA